MGGNDRDQGLHNRIQRLASDFVIAMTVVQRLDALKRPIAVVHHECWIRLELNGIKINLDRAIDFVHKMTIVGILACTTDGLSLGCRNNKVVFSSPLVVELIAIKEGLIFSSKKVRLIVLWKPT